MEMMDIIVQIMVEVLSILGIATKELKQGRMSKWCCTNMTMLAERYLEKYVKKLIGGAEIDDALKRLDKLTQEEARMAATQNLKVVHTVDERVKGVTDTVVAIDNRVAGIDDRVASVNDQVAGVDGRVANVSDRVVTVDDRVKVVDNKVMEVIAGV
jgi:hypothetical protein